MMALRLDATVALDGADPPLATRPSPPSTVVVPSSPHSPPSLPPPTYIHTNVHTFMHTYIQTETDRHACIFAYMHTCKKDTMMMIAVSGAEIHVVCERDKRRLYDASTQKKLCAPTCAHIARNCLRAPQAFENDALRHKQLHARRSDRSVVLLLGQGRPRTERLQR